MMLNVPEPRKKSFSTILIVIVASSLLTGVLIGYFADQNATSNKITTLHEQVVSLQNQIQLLQVSFSLFKEALTNTSNNDVTLHNLDTTIVQMQNQLSSLQQQIIGVENTPNLIDPNITALQSKLESVQSTLSSIQGELSTLQSPSPSNVSYQNVTYVIDGNVSLNQLFEQVKTSVVVVQGLIRQVDFFGRVYYSQVQGSGFVCNHTGRLIVLTNNHVISGAINITVTFTDSKTIPVTVVGSNADTDFAILSPGTSIVGYKPLEIISSSSLRIGDPVIVVGTPYGLAGSMSNGIVSALNRTLSTSTNTELSHVIQTTAPLNPGNSGGPVMNYLGQVVGIATAIVQESQGIGFAISSDTVLGELNRMLPTA